MSDVQEEADACRLLMLPQDCLLRIVQLLSPVEACIAARVCKALRHAVDSDQNWEPRLPPLSERPQNVLSKKDLFFRLRARMIHKDFSQPYWLDPDTGEGCFVVPARALDIVWGDDWRYWNWIEHPSSWFSEVAELKSVCWFHVSGHFENVFLPGRYTVSFRVMFTREPYEWSRTPVKFKLSSSNGYNRESNRYFHGEQTRIRSQNLTPLRRLGTWVELDMGEITVTEQMKLLLQFSMFEIEGGNWKHGLIIDCVKIQPSSAIR